MNADRWLNRIHHGDCLELMAAMPPGIADLIVTSPPYNLLNSAGNGLGSRCNGKWDGAALGPVDAKIQAMTVRRFPLQSTASNDEKRLPSDDLPQCSRRNVGAGIGTPSVKSLDVNRP